MKMGKYGVCEVLFYPFVHFFMTHNADNNHHLEKLSHWNRKKISFFGNVLNTIW